MAVTGAGSGGSGQSGRGRQRRQALENEGITAAVPHPTYAVPVSLALIWRDLPGFTSDGSACGVPRPDTRYLKVRERRCSCQLFAPDKECP